MRVVSVVGYSGAGKTTVAEELIRHFVASGYSVAAIKHTHHLVKALPGGDTQRFRNAGAREIILAGDRQAVRWRAETPPEMIQFDDPQELLSTIDSDWLLIEGFKSRPSGSVVVVERDNVETLPRWPPSVVALVSERTAEGTVPVFSRERIAELATFLDRITAS